MRLFPIRRRKPTPPPAPPEDSPGDSPDELLAAINRVRIKPLNHSPCLQQQAEEHCRYMIRYEISHKGFKQRLTSCRYQTGAENVAAGQRTPRECVDAWMNSSGHRKNMLGDWDVCGFARVDNYWCAIFAA